METISFENLPQAVNELSQKIDNLVRLTLEKSKDLHTKTDKFLTIQQASELICLSVPTVYGLVHRAAIPCMKRNKRLYFSEQQLTDWIKSGRKKTISEIEAEAINSLSSKKRG